MTSPRRAILIALLGASGLALYVWPALRAPVVMWSDSRIDLEWARQGVGILTPAPPPPSPHPAKPGWIAFLRAATAGGGGDAPRRVVFVQSILLWLSIAGTSVFVARRTSFVRGLALYAVLVLFLRLPDAATSVMSEAITAALFLPIAAVLLDPPARVGLGLALGTANGILFLVRPNAGIAATALALLAFVSARRWKPLAAFGIAGIVLVLPIWILTWPPGGDALRGLGPAFDWASAEYCWINAPGLVPPDRAEATRQLIFRLFHGLLGSEYNDGSWSPVWSVLDETSRGLSPFLVLATLSSLFAPSRGAEKLARPLGLVLVTLLVAQSYVIGSLPRYALPFLPALFLFAVAAWPPVKSIAAGVFVALLAAARGQRHVLDREWGRIEAAGVRIVQRIPRGALPETTPATLRIRVSPAAVPSSAELLVLGPQEAVLYDSREDPDRRRPYVEVPLTPELVAENRRGPVDLALVSAGAYGDTQFLLFPVIPLPWGPAAKREGSEFLSPSTGLVSGSLDWWARAP